MEHRRIPDNIYHGSLDIVSEPKTDSNKKRPMDFGEGFYCTSDFNQAKRWAKSKLRKDTECKTDTAYVNWYVIDKQTFEKLNIKDFGETPTIEWLDCILQNHDAIGVKMPYDVIIGPVADDKAYQAIEEFKEKGDYSVSAKTNLIKKLKTYKLVNQYLFVTNKSLLTIKFKQPLRVTLSKKKGDGKRTIQNKRK